MGLSDPSGVLEAITATVDELCACGCGVALAGSVSAWFAGPGCQQRWQAGRADRPMRDEGRMAGILPGWERDAAGPDGGRFGDGGWVHAGTGRIDLASVDVPASSPYLDIWTDMIVRGEVYLTCDGGRVRPVPMSEELRTRVDLSRTPTLAATLNLPPDTVVEFDTTPLREVFGALREGMAMYADAVRTAAAGIGRAVEHLHAAGVLPPPPPADARQATLAAVRARRNSGPAGRGRAPQRIDPRRGAPRR